MAPPQMLTSDAGYLSAFALASPNNLAAGTPTDRAKHIESTKPKSSQILCAWVNEFDELKSGHYRTTFSMASCAIAANSAL